MRAELRVHSREHLAHHFPQKSCSRPSPHLFLVRTESPDPCWLPRVLEMGIWVETGTCLFRQGFTYLKRYLQKKIKIKKT